VSYSVVVRHGFETAHRLPHLGGALITKVVIAETSANTAIWCLEGAP